MGPNVSLSPRPALSVVIPLFNEEGVVRELCQRVSVSAHDCCDNVEIIFVNDGSIDATLERLILLSKENPQMRIINLTRNFGHMSALTAGINASKGDVVIVIDGDLQDPPEIFRMLFEKWKSGAEVVLAVRTKRCESFVRQIGTRIFYALLSKWSGKLVPSQAGTYCLMDRKVVEILRQLPEKERFFAGLRAWVGFKQDVVLYERDKRYVGKSRVGLFGLMRLARTGIVSFSDVPLRIAAGFSFFACLLLLFFGSSVALIKVFTSLAVPGWASMMVLTGFVGSFISLVLAVLCEYVAVIFKEVKGRPDFLVYSEIRSGHVVKFGAFN